jgi:uncharacterized protein
MVRLLILVLVVGLAVWLLFGRSRSRTAARDTNRTPKPTAFAVCAHCGVHLPAHDAVLDGDTAYCSDAHRLAGPRDRS